MPGQIWFDDTDLRARLRPLSRASGPAEYVSRPVPEPSRKLFQDVTQIEQFEFPAQYAQPSVPAPTTLTAPARQVFPTKPRKPEPSQVLMRAAVLAQTTVQPASHDLEPAAPLGVPFQPRPVEHRTFEPPAKPSRLHKPSAAKFTAKPKRIIIKFKRTFQAMPLQQQLLTGLAAFVFVAGVGISLSGFMANDASKIQTAQANIAGATSATTTGSGNSAPSTAQITADTLRAYKVAPDMARYISIPRLGVMARVLQAGVTKDGAMAVPANVYDAAWYTGSAKPGQPGAALIDGHVSSWTTNGVFFGIKKLVTGDTIGIERGDGKQLSYTVVKTVTFPAESVDMKSLMLPVTAGKSGLNLITCGGKYDSKAGEFTQRVAVYATLND